MDRCGRFDPATRDVDVEQTQIGRIAERRGYGGRRAFLFRADDEPVLLEREPSADARCWMLVCNHDARVRWSRGTATCVCAQHSCTPDLARPTLARSDSHPLGPHLRL